jgi:hypothetical protein
MPDKGEKIENAVRALMVFMLLLFLVLLFVSTF